MKKQNKQLDEIAQLIEELEHENDLVERLYFDAANKLRLAVFEDEKEEVTKQANALKEEKEDYDSTALAEEIASCWNVDFENGPLDQEDHWIWEIVL